MPAGVPFGILPLIKVLKLPFGIVPINVPLVLAGVQRYKRMVLFQRKQPVILIGTPMVEPCPKGPAWKEALVMVVVWAKPVFGDVAATMHNNNTFQSAPRALETLQAANFINQGFGLPFAQV